MGRASCGYFAVWSVNTQNPGLLDELPVASSIWNLSIGHFKRGQRFPHTDFTVGSSWSHKFATLPNRKLLGLKVSGTSYIASLLTMDYGLFLLVKFYWKFANVTAPLATEMSFHGAFIVNIWEYNFLAFMLILISWLCIEKPSRHGYLVSGWCQGFALILNIEAFHMQSFAS